LQQQFFCRDSNDDRTIKGQSQTVLTNAQGKTLYYFTADSASKGFPLCFVYISSGGVDWQRFSQGYCVGLHRLHPPPRV